VGVGQKHVAKHFEKECNKPKSCMEGMKRGINSTLLRHNWLQFLNLFFWIEHPLFFVGENYEVRLTESSSNSELISDHAISLTISWLIVPKNGSNLWVISYNVATPMPYDTIPQLPNDLPFGKS
jgi:hypothetical protein